MNLPDKAVVIADNKSELADLMLFLDIHGFTWPSGASCSSVVDTIWNNTNVRSHGDDIAVNFLNGKPDGFCWVDYYRSGGKSYLSENQEWNFLSVPDFVSKVGGVIPRFSVTDLL